jgi:hypothetical protein
MWQVVFQLPSQQQLQKGNETWQPWNIGQQDRRQGQHLENIQDDSEPLFFQNVLDHIYDRDIRIFQ